MSDRLLTLVQLADLLTAAGAGDAVPRDRLDAADELRGLARAAFRRPVLPDRLTEKNVAAAARDYATALAAADRANQASAAVETALARDVRAAFIEALPGIDAALADTFTVAAAVVHLLATDVAAHRTPADLVAAGPEAVEAAGRYARAVSRLDAVAVARAEAAEVLDRADRRVPPAVRFVADLDRDVLRRVVERFDSPAPSSPFVHRPDLADRWARIVREGAVLAYRTPDDAAATWQAATTRQPVTA